MTKIEIADCDELFDYLEEKYPGAGRRGHRGLFAEAAEDVAERLVCYGQMSVFDGMIMREAWECAKGGQGNIATGALAAAIFCETASLEHIEIMCAMPGFLTPRERWHTARLDGATLYRGCSEAEIDSPELGLSWTLDREVADFFARIHHGKVISTTFDKRAMGGAWLDTAESEVILTIWKDPDDLTRLIEDAQGAKKDMTWDTRLHLTPAIARRIAA